LCDIDTYVAAGAALLLLVDYQAVSETWHWHEWASADWKSSAASNNRHGRML